MICELSKLITYESQNETCAKRSETERKRDRERKSKTKWERIDRSMFGEREKWRTPNICHLLKMKALAISATSTHVFYKYEYRVTIHWIK